MKEYEFDALILKHEGMNATFIEFPYNVEKEFGIKGRVKVHATFDGVEYRGSLVKMGHHCHIMGITQKIRKEIDKNPGDTVHVILKQDTEPGVVKIPQDLDEILNHHTEAREFFDSLSYSNKKAYVQWIEGAKKEETRQKRLQKSLNLLRAKVKHP